MARAKGGETHDEMSISPGGGGCPGRRRAHMGEEEGAGGF